MARGKIKREAETPAKWRLNNKLDESIDKHNKIIKYNEYYGNQLYLKCQYLSLAKYSSDDDLIANELKKLYDRTDKYVEDCIQDKEFKCAIANNDIENYLMKLATVNTRYNKYREEFNLILVVATLGGYLFQDLSSAYRELSLQNLKVSSQA